MKTLKKYEIKNLDLPVYDYTCYVMLFTSVDNGKSFWYCGNSKYFKTYDEAVQYKSEQEKTL